MLSMMKALEACLAPLTAAIQRDTEKDAQVAERLGSLETRLASFEQALGSFTTTLAEFTQALHTPQTRTGIVDLPTGQVKMTITEARNRATRN